MIEEGHEQKLEKKCDQSEGRAGVARRLWTRLLLVMLNGEKRARVGGATDVIRIGDLILGKYKRTSGWYRCKVVAMAEGGTWVVEWEGGDKEDTVRDPRHLKIKSESLKVHRLCPQTKHFLCL